MSSELATCPTPWCNSSSIHTTTFHKSKKGAKDGDLRVCYIDVEHSCKSCGVRTPQLSREDADAMWNQTETKMED